QLLAGADLTDDERARVRTDIATLRATVKTYEQTRTRFQQSPDTFPPDDLPALAMDALRRREDDVASLAIRMFGRAHGLPWAARLKSLEPLVRSMEALRNGA